MGSGIYVCDACLRDNASPHPDTARADAAERMLAFAGRVFALFDKHDRHESLFFRTGNVYGGGEYAKPAAFFVICNDAFWWGTGDLEEITPENIDVLEQAFADCHAAENVVGTINAAELFAARVRKMRPQGAAYPSEPELWPLFDACGPERETDMGNPHPHPSKKKPRDPVAMLTARRDAARAEAARLDAELAALTGGKES